VELFSTFPLLKQVNGDASMVVTKIRKTESGDLALTWDDGKEAVVPLKLLRDHCPCAGCQGETVLLHTYTPVVQPELPGKYELKGIEAVGRYALKLAWGDGHDSGIYPWAILRSLCDAHAA
jgi:DUF971 family protein